MTHLKVKPEVIKKVIYISHILMIHKLCNNYICFISICTVSFLYFFIILLRTPSWAETCN